MMAETVAVLNCLRRSKWLIQMVKSKLFHELCDQHPKQRRCYFCWDCMIPPLCITCHRKNKNEHIGHTMIQTYRSSYQTGIKIEMISEYMDISGIHKYSINGFQIVYIFQRRVIDNNNHRVRNKASRKCQVCEWELDPATSALFCSVECKLRSALGPQFDELMEKSEESPGALISQLDELIRSKESMSALGSRLDECELMEKSEESRSALRSQPEEMEKSEESRSALRSQPEELMEKSEESRSALRSQPDELMEKSEESRRALRSQPDELMEESEEAKPVKRKRGRKGIPHRAPFH